MTKIVTTTDIPQTPSLLDNLITAAQMMSGLEVIAVICGLLYLVLILRENIWGWFFALVSTSLYIHLFWDATLYMESALNVYYVIMAFVGWWQWKHGKISSNESLHIQTWPISRHAIAIAFVLILSYISGYLLNTYTDASYSYLDSFTSWSAVFATWLVARKVLSNWIYWIVIDIIGSWVFWQKGFYLTSLLFGLYTIIAIFGFIEWRKRYRQQH